MTEENPSPPIPEHLAPLKLIFFLYLLPTLAVISSYVVCWLIQVRIMRKRLVRKTFDMIEEISEKEDKEVEVCLFICLLDCSFTWY